MVAARLFDQAEQLSQKAGDKFVTVEYMLLSLALAGGAAADVLKQNGVTAQNLNKAIPDRPLRHGKDQRSGASGHWPLFFNFGSAGSGLEDISWDRFFAEFERAALAFVYRDTGPNGELDDLHEFVRRAAVAELAISGNSTITGQVI